MSDPSRYDPPDDVEPPDCPACGEPMEFRERDMGRLIWACSMGSECPAYVARDSE